MFTRLHECDSLFEDQVVSAATPEHIMQVGLGFWASKTLLSAVELGVFSTLADAPADLPTLQRKLALHQRSARDFLDALVALKLLERENGVYSNTADTDLFLDRAKPSYIGGVLEMANARLYGFWGSLTEARRTGEVQNENKVGGEKSVFAAVYADPDQLRGFLTAMSGISAGPARAIAGNFLKRLQDLHGSWFSSGHGTRHSRLRPSPRRRHRFRPSRSQARLRGIYRSPRGD
jgi:hypothetical protein